MTNEAANTTPAGELPQARIIKPEGRTATVKLDWPVEFDGKIYEEITIRRLIGREVEEFLEAINTRKDGDPRSKPPMIDCPVEVYSEMDDDDRLRVEEAMLPFLPLRLQRMVASTPSTAGDTSAS